MDGMRDKVALVTGGSRGIGEAIVRTLCGAGAEVVLHYNSSGREAKRIASETGRCLCVKADLEEEYSVDELWSEAVGWRGHVDVLVNNAGVYEPASLEDGERWKMLWQRALKINLIAAADLCREAILHFERRGGGTIINIASRAAFRGDDPEYMPYAASKGGMVSLTRTIARGFAASGILAYTVAPGFVETQMAREFALRSGENPAREIPLGSLVPPEEVANVVAFLASGAARHATGATIDLNGASYVH
jgi:3-oxoacyl-[acyl-carrier protein] reductase